MQDLPQFGEFLKSYFFTKFLNFGHSFEAIKDVIVAFLIVKRGRYSSSFLNTSFLLIIASTFIAGPTIIENSPFGSRPQDAAIYQAAVVSYNPYESALETVISTKPRSTVEDYQVKGGDTLEAIAKKYEVTTDTIKWANDLKTDVIKPGQVLKIPPVSGVIHTVASGETVYSIAKKYRTEAQSIVNFPFNDFVDLDTFSLASGQILYVPGGVIETAPPSARFVAQIQAGVRGSSTFIWPASGIITQEPVWYHMALDIANNAAPAILASDGGTVTYAGCVSYGYGCSIIIDHGNGYQSLYAHLSSYGVEPGDVVSQGSQIGFMGSTGRSTGTHLHFEIRSGGSQLNPLNFLR